MGFIFLGLLVDALQDFVGVGIHVEIHFLVVVLDQVSSIGLQAFEQVVSVLEIPVFAGNHMHDHLLALLVLGRVLNVHSGRRAIVVTLQGLGNECDGEGQVEHLDRVQGRERGSGANGGDEDI